MSDSNFQRDPVAVFGCGLVGRAWAITFARAGHPVRLFDEKTSAMDAAMAFAATAVPDLEQHGLLAGEAAADVLGRLQCATSLDAALDGAVHVQESTFEDVEVKKGVFSRLDAAADESTVLASSTSAILPSAFTEHLTGRHRCVVAHPINPPYLVPAVEVVPAPWTDEATRERTGAFMRAAGQAPIMMTREIDGFVMNRMQGALLQEAFRLVGAGYATAEDIDIGIREGLGLRWSFMGPFETIDLNAPAGVADYIDRFEGMYSKMAESQRDPVTWAGDLGGRIEEERRTLLAEDQLGDRTIWRDRRLMALRAHQAAADDGSSES